ncbi:MAG TPA: transcription-repair coupling factor [Armatimonadota bacterium]|jgi:transcription-repair coupling factor (superfamily II helicase)
MLQDVIRSLAHAEPLAPLRAGFARRAARQWLYGVRGTGKSLAIAALLQACQEAMQPRVQFILAPSQERAETLYTDLTVLYGREEASSSIVFCPSLESLLYEETSPDLHLIRERLTVLSRLASGEALVVIATPDATLHRTLPPNVMAESVRVVRAHEEIDPAVLAEWLAFVGYSREAMVENPGQFSLRGGVLDIYPSTADAPVRLEFFGDEIDALRVFDPGSQRSHHAQEAVTLFPAREILLTPDRVAAAEPLIRQALQARLGEISHAPVRLPGDDGKMEELLAPSERLSAKIEHEMELLAQGAYFNGVEYYLPYLCPEGTTLLDYLPADATVILDEPEHIAHAFHRFQDGLAQLETARLNRGALLPVPHPLYLPLNDGLAQLAQGHPEVAVSLLPPGADASFTAPQVKSLEELSPLPAVDAMEGPPPSAGPDLDGALVDLACQSPVNYLVMADQLQPDFLHWLHEGYVVAAATHQEHRLAEMLGEIGLPTLSGDAAHPTPEGEAPTGAIIVRRADLGEGVIIPSAKVALLSDGELLGWQKQRRSVHSRPTQGQALASVGQLAPGDYVVHINHGIGRYTGLIRRNIQGVDREFLQIDYAGSDKLFVPVDQLDRVQKYLTIGEETPSVHRLGGGEWERTKRRTKKSTEELAKQLMLVQAARSHETGHAFPPDTPWQREMEEGFPWQETPDQLRAIAEVKAEMETAKPMDRLVCGDVGFGKTEVAIRAAFKAVMDGKQVAVLVPTTVLASQHYRNFRERMAAFPVRVELLSRSVPRREQTRIIGDVIGGAVDVIIGTHRILSQDVKPKNLGLVIIDEEQRFGVKQKERFKQLKENVDVLLMSATPIPRTLHMALSGLREMSVINTPPEGRMPVRTLAMEADDEVLREAILRELDRDGQVFVLHNRISSIYHVAEHIRQVVPQARVEVAHGQMAEGELDGLMVDFYQRKFDVLVCTSIIENGIDLPNVNTIIVDQAEMFGLAQMYQLRGRVGRSDRQAYAYLTWKPRKRLTETAQERIGALKEFSSLGSGYKVALRDLEIRGAGDLLGAEQSGVLTAVGYDLYCQMLEEAVAMVQGQYVEQEREIQIDLPLDAYIPEEYVPVLNQRIDLYRRLAAVREARFADDLRAEMLDRFGQPLPVPVDSLFRLLAVKLMCLETGITHIGSERGAVVLRIAPERVLSPQAVKRLSQEAPSWRQRDLPAPGYTPERATIYTHNLEQDTILSMLEEVAGRLRVIEQEVAKAPRPAKLTTPNRRDLDMRPFGRR